MGETRRTRSKQGSNEQNSDRQFKKLCTTIRTKMESQNLDSGKAFSKFDRSGDGTVTHEEFLDVLRNNFNVPVSEKMGKRLIDWIDDDGNGLISYHELSNKLLNDAEEKEAARKIAQAAQYRNSTRERHHQTNFIIGDVDEDGKAPVPVPAASTITPTIDPEIKEICRSIITKLESQNLDSGKAFSKFDISGDGTVTRDEFLQVLRDGFNLPLDKKQGKKLMDWLDDDGNGVISYHELSSKMLNDDDEKAQGKLIAEQSMNRNLQRAKHHRTNFFIGDDRGVKMESPLEKFEKVETRKLILDTIRNNGPTLASALNACPSNREGTVSIEDFSNSLAEVGLHIAPAKLAAAVGELENSVVQIEDLPSKLANMQRLALSTRVQDGYGRTSYKRRITPGGTPRHDHMVRKKDVTMEQSHHEEVLEKNDEELLREVRSKMIASNLSAPELFQSYDIDKSGKISYDEFKATLRHLNVQLNDKECDRVVRIVDLDGDGEIETAEFNRLCSNYHNERGLVGAEPNNVKNVTFTSPSNLVNSPMAKDTEWNEHMQYVNSDLAGMGRVTSPSGGKKNKFEDETADEIPVDTTEKLLIKRVNGRIERIKAAFSVLDGDRDGSVTHDEFSRTLSRLGMKLRPNQLWGLINQYDPSGKGAIDYLQFAESLSQISGRSVEDKAKVARRKCADRLLSRSGNLAKVFASFDKDNSGTLDYVEMEKGLTALGVGLSKDDLNCLFVSTDKHRTGEIDYEEFVQSLTDLDYLPEGSTVQYDYRKGSFSSLGISKDDIIASQNRAPTAARRKVLSKEEKKQKLVRQRITDRIQSYKASFRDIFLRMDTSGDQTLDQNELRAGLESIGISLSNADFTNVWRSVDTNKSGDVSLDEFVQAFSQEDEATGFGIFTGNGYSDGSHATYRTTLHTEQQKAKIGKKIFPHSPNYVHTDIFNEVETPHHKRYLDLNDKGRRKSTSQLSHLNVHDPRTIPDIGKDESNPRRIARSLSVSSSPRGGLGQNSSNIFRTEKVNPGDIPTAGIRSKFKQKPSETVAASIVHRDLTTTGTKQPSVVTRTPYALDNQSRPDSHKIYHLREKAPIVAWS